MRFSRVEDHHGAWILLIVEKRLYREHLPGYLGRLLEASYRVEDVVDNAIEQDDVELP